MNARLLALLALSFGLKAFGYANGIVGYSGQSAGNTCASCHGVNTALAAPTVTITGPATLTPGATGNYVLTLTGGPGVRGGMNVAADVATAQLLGDASTTQASAGEVTHNGAKTFVGGSLSFNFSMVAPATAGVVKLFGAGNSCNNAGGSVGDREGLTTFNVTVGSAPPVNAAPTIATAAASTAGSTTASLSVLGADDSGEAALLYTWASTGPAAAALSVNGTNGAKNTVATFTRAGSYTFTVTVRDAAGLTVTSITAVAVTAALASIQVTPATVGLAPGGAQQFTASGVDQFGQPLAASATWTASAGGAISPAGLFTAGATAGGPHTITAAAGARTATAQVTISAGSPPTVAQTARAAVAPVVGKTAALSVLGADDGGEAALLYSWTAVAPLAPVTFSANGTNAAKNVTATFTRAGSYNFNVTIRDAAGLSTTSAVTVAVNATLTAMAVSPATTTVAIGAAAQLLASGTDQFAAPLAGAPSVTWSVASGGTVTAAGLFTAGAAAGGPFTVTAAAGAVTATAQITVSSAAGPTFAQPPSATPAVVAGRSSSLKLLGADTAGETLLVYHWSATGPAPVTFSVNDRNAAKNTTITFTLAGTYRVTAQAKNAAGLTADAIVELTVEQTLSALTLSPAAATVAAAGVQQFRAEQVDQFAVAMTAPGDVAWTVAGSGTIGSDGVFQAPTASGGPWLVSGTANGVRGTALITVGSGGGVVDVVPPQVSMVNVAGGARLSGAMTVSAHVSDAVMVELQLDGQTIATRTVAPWEFMFDTTGRPNGSHTLEVVARDAAGNVGRTPKININIQNAIEMLGAISGETELPGCSAGPGALLAALGMLIPAFARRRRG